MSQSSYLPKDAELPERPAGPQRDLKFESQRTPPLGLSVLQEFVVGERSGAALCHVIQYVLPGVTRHSGTAASLP